MTIIKNPYIDGFLAWHYARLYWGCNWAQYNQNDESVEHLETAYWNIYIPKGLSDEDKFLCVILSCKEGQCINSNNLKDLFGWTKYKAMKIRKKVYHIITVSCICEDGEGYCGKGWCLDGDIEDRIKELQIRMHCNCARCATVIRCIDTNDFYCPISKYNISALVISERYCKYEKLEVNDVFNNFWNEKH